MLNLSRRNFLSVGAFGILSMPQVLQAQNENNTQHKAVINIFLAGGPPHQDMWDIKEDAPSEIRGEFKPISTNVAGIQIGECFPKIASMVSMKYLSLVIIGAFLYSAKINSNNAASPLALFILSMAYPFASLINCLASPSAL